MSGSLSIFLQAVGKAGDVVDVPVVWPTVPFFADRLLIADVDSTKRTVIVPTLEYSASQLVGWVVDGNDVFSGRPSLQHSWRGIPSYVFSSVSIGGGVQPAQAPPGSAVVLRVRFVQDCDWCAVIKGRLRG